MGNIIRDVIKAPDIRRRLLFTCGILFVYRFLVHTPIPGANISALRQLFGSSSFLGLLNVFTGGGLANFSIITLGLGPYINASIIMQLFTKAIPKLEELSKEGEWGRIKINQYTRILAIPLSSAQAFGVYSLLSRQGVVSPMGSAGVALVILTMTAGSMLLVWLGELISEFGVGNGVSLLIFSGIVARMPLPVGRMIATLSVTGVGSLFITLSIFVIVMLGVVFVNEATRNVKIQYARRIRGGRLYGGGTNYLPIRINMAGMIPIIFALSLVMAPSLIANFLSASPNPTVANAAQTVTRLLSLGSPLYNTLYFLLVFAFTYFYTAVTFNVDDVADNLKKQGGFIPGVRPGKKTADYLNTIVTRITLVGALFLGSIAVLPNIVQGMTGITSLTIGGAGILIVVSVVLETVKSVQSQLIMRDYDKKIV